MAIFDCSYSCGKPRISPYWNTHSQPPMRSEAKHRPRAEDRSRTCDTCKLRHQKCSGAKPACQNCALRGLQCNYSNTQARKIDPVAVRRKNLASHLYGSSLPSPKRKTFDIGASPIAADNYSIIHEILITGLSDSGLSAQRQSELSWCLTDDIIRKTQFPRLSQPDVHDPSKGVDTNTTTAQHLISILARIWANELGVESNTILTGTAAGKDDTKQNRTIPTGGVPCSLASRRELLPPKDRADKWLQTYLGGPNKLMHICSPRESQQLLDTLYDPQQGISPKSECLITWQLAVGARFTVDTNEQTYTAIYENARMQTEMCIEEDDDMLLWVVPTLLLRCVYLMNPQPRNCWLILGLAIRISQTHRIDLQREQCPHLSDAVFSRWREVWRATIFLDSWLATILGRVSQITALTSHDPFIQNIRTELRSPNHELEVNMAKLAVLMSEFRSNRDPPNQVDLTTYERHLHSLEGWSSSLPQSLQSFPKSSNITRQSNLSIEDEVASLYLELFYFASVLILTKPLLLDIVTTYRGMEDIPAPSNVRFFAQTCTNSAIQIAHISTTMVRQGFICQRSWLVTKLNYHASLILALSLSMEGPRTRWNLTSAQEASRRQVGMNGLELSVGVLSFCAQQDFHAGQFLKIVNVFKDILETHGLSEPEQPQNPPFGWPISGPARPLGSYMLTSGLSSEVASSGVLANPDLTPPTVASTFEFPRYSSTSSFSAPSLSYAQYTSAEHFTSQPARARPQVDTYPMPFDWTPLSTVGPEPALDLGRDCYPGPSDPVKQHYQPFLQDFYHLEETG